MTEPSSWWWLSLDYKVRVIIASIPYGLLAIAVWLILSLLFLVITPPPSPGGNPFPFFWVFIISPILIGAATFYLTKPFVIKTADGVQPTPDPPPAPETPQVYEPEKLDVWALIAELNTPIPPRELIPTLEGMPHAAVTAYLQALPKPEDAAFTIPLYERVNVREVLYQMMVHMRGTEAYQRYYNQALLLTGQDPKAKVFMWPQHFKGSQEEVINVYLKDNPLKPLFEIPVPFPLYDTTRFEHMWLIANSGHGKTQTIQQMLAHDLERDVGLVVIDSQNKLIPLLATKVPAERLVLIDAEHTPPAINLLKLSAKNPNEMLSLYQFLISTIMGHEMSENHKTLFQNCVLLLKLKDGATLKDLYALLDTTTQGNLAPYTHLIPKLDEFGRQFFNKDFHSKGETDGYEGTRRQLRRRLNTLFRSSPFKEMFSSPEHKITLPEFLDEGKVVLINTAGLGDDTKLFGRFMLTLVAHAMRQRSDNSKPAFVYVDECDQYVKDDPTAIDLLARARKTNMGLIFAHRWIDEIGTSVAKGLEATTAIIFAGGLRGTDAAHMSKIMDCNPTLLRREKKGLFTAYVRGIPITTVQATFGILDKLPTVNPAPSGKQYGVGQTFEDVPVEEDSYE